MGRKQCKGLQMCRHPDRTASDLWLLPVLSGAAVYALLGLTGLAKGWLEALVGAAVCGTSVLFGKRKRFGSCSLAAMLLVLLLCKSRLFDGFCQWYNLLGRIYTAENGIVLPHLQASADPQNIHIFTCWLAAALGMGMAFLSRAAGAAVLMICAGVCLALGRMIDPLPLILAAAALCTGRGWRHQVLPIGILAAAYLLSGIPAFSGWADDLSEAVLLEVHAGRYETKYTTLPEGRLEPIRQSDSAALIVTMEKPEVLYDTETDAYYFTSKGGSFYGVRVDAGQLTDLWSTELGGNSTSSPSVYNGRAYVGVAGSGQFAAYSGHSIQVIDLKNKSIAYAAGTQGYPQTSGLLTTSYEEESGYVYIYFFDNMTPGKLRVLRDKPGQTQLDYVTTEGQSSTVYTLFTPTGDQAQYAICSPIADEYGTIYFKNDSAHLMAFGSRIVRLDVAVEPEKMVYQEGESFDPEGMTVMATYANGKMRDVTEYVTIAADPITPDNTTVTISFHHVMYHNQEEGTGMISGVAATTPVTTLEVKLAGVEGDVSGDGILDREDAKLIVKHYNELLELNVEELEIADVNADGVADILDANILYGWINLGRNDA